jgi:hypothetical protein
VVVVSVDQNDIQIFVAKPPPATTTRVLLLPVLPVMLISPFAGRLCARMRFFCFEHHPIL